MFRLIILQFLLHFFINPTYGVHIDMTHRKKGRLLKEDWCYNHGRCGPKTWKDQCPSSRAQSPIDIDTSQSTVSSENTTITFNNVFMKTHKSFKLENNGHTIQLTLDTPKPATMKIAYDTSDFHEEYTFDQIHFHFGSDNRRGSEHTMDRKAYPLEMHIVHHKSKHDSLYSALMGGSPEGLAVLGVFFEISRNDNPNIKPIVSQLRKFIKPGGARVINKPINIYRLIPRNLNFFTYKGSLTTPPCAEVVLWNVFQTPLPISKRQLNQFRKLMDHEHEHISDNFRPVQKLSGRPLVLYKNVRVGGAH